MPHFHFHLRAKGTLLRDPEGTELPDLAAARAHGTHVAHELMRNTRAGTRQWSFRVEDGAGKRQFDLFFVDVDPRLAAFHPQMRIVASQTCRRVGALIDTMCEVRAVVIESRILLARVQHKPQLVTDRGR